MYKNKVNHCRKIFLEGLALFFCLFVILPSCFASPSINAIIRGTTYDQTTGRPISGAVVSLNAPNGVSIISAATDRYGNFTIRKTLPPAVYKLTCSKTNYQTKTNYLYPRYSYTYRINFSLKQIPQNKPPQITSFAPKNLSTLYGGETLKINMQAKDPDSAESVQYRFLMDNVVLKNWSSLAELDRKSVV
jgi:hypothetical protein